MHQPKEKKTQEGYWQSEGRGYIDVRMTSLDANYIQLQFIS